VCKGVAIKHLRPGPEIQRRRRTARQVPSPTLPDEPAIFFYFFFGVSLLFCLEGKGAWLMLFFFWTHAVCARGSPENTSGPALIFGGVAGQPGRPRCRPCRMSLLFFIFFWSACYFASFFFCYFASWVKGPGSCCVFKGVARKHLRPDIRIDSGVPLSWLRGRSPVLSIRRFVSRWGVAGGGVYVVVDGDLHVTLQSLDDT
jgi:hypothetical protein